MSETRKTYHVETIQLGDVQAGDIILMPARRGAPAWRAVRCIEKGEKLTRAWDHEKGAADAARGAHVHWEISGYNEQLVQIQVADVAYRSQGG